MRAYVATFVILVCGVSSAVTAIVLFLTTGIKVPETYWAAAINEKKLAQVSRIPGPKIVIVGGSNAHFGLRADMIEAATGRPAFNLATHFGLGPAYLFFLAKPMLHRGDIVILPFEYDAYLGNAPLLNKLNVSVSYSRGLGYFWHLGLLDEIQYFREISLHQVWTAAMIRLGQEPAPQRAVEGYQPATSDRWGDETETANTAVPTDNIVDFEHRICPAPFVPNATGIAELRRFVDWTKANGIVLLATWPNVLADSCEAEAPFKATVASVRALYRELGVTLIGTPQQATLPLELMRDSVYHPTVRGAELRTERFVKELCAETSLCGEGGTARASAPPGVR